MEHFAEAAFILHQRTKKNHNWKKEGDLEGPPPFLLPQVRRLYQMIEHESPERKNCFQRHIDDCVHGTDLSELAAALIVEYQTKGSIDWDQEEYIMNCQATLPATESGT